MTMLANDRTEFSTASNGHSKPHSLNGSHVTPTLSRSGTLRKSAIHTTHRGGWRSYAAYAAATSVAAVALGAGLRPWISHRSAPHVAVKSAETRRAVTVTQAKQQIGGSVRLPATVEAFQNATLHERP